MSVTQHRPPPTYFRYSTIRYSSDKTTSGIEIRMAGILEFYFRFRFSRVYRHRHVILHLLARFRSNRTISVRVITSYRFFNMAAMKSEIYFRIDI